MLAADNREFDEDEDEDESEDESVIESEVESDDSSSEDNGAEDSDGNELRPDDADDTEGRTGPLTGDDIELALDVSDDMIFEPGTSECKKQKLHLCLLDVARCTITAETTEEFVETRTKEIRARIWNSVLRFKGIDTWVCAVVDLWKHQKAKGQNDRTHPREGPVKSLLHTFKQLKRARDIYHFIDSGRGEFNLGGDPDVWPAPKAGRAELWPRSDCLAVWIIFFEAIADAAKCRTPEALALYHRVRARDREIAYKLRDWEYHLGLVPTGRAAWKPFAKMTDNG